MVLGELEAARRAEPGVIPEGSGTGYPGGAGGGYPGGRGGGGGFTPSLNLTVRWYSALPIKQALAAHRYGSEAQADENLKREETHYTIGLSRGQWGPVSR